MVVSSDPDVIALQEVRLDGNFVSPTALHHWNSNLNGRATESTKLDAGSQVEHLLSHLALARQRAALAFDAAAANNSHSASSSDEDTTATERLQPYYQFVYQPAMSMIDG